MKGSNQKVLKKIGVGLCAMSLLSGCLAPVGAPGTPRPVAQTAVQKAIGKCVLTVGGGAILGALIGGGRDGAVAGAVVGGAACAVFLQVASKEDQARLAAAEKAALKANRSTTRSFETSSGKKAVVKTKVQAAPTPKAPAKTASVVTKAPKFTACRYATQTITVDGQSSAAPKQLWCRVDTGDWQAVSG